MKTLRTTLALGAVLALSACFGGKAPDYYMTLTPAQARPSAATRTAAEGQAITVVVPTVPRELTNTRVPVRSGGTRLEYLKGAFWSDVPNTLFGRLLSETIAASTGRVVLDPKQFSFDPGQRLTGQLQFFGLDADTMEAVATYDAALGRAAGGVATRRFEARVPVTAADAANVAPALNQAANQVATEVAGWIGSGGA